MPGEELKAQTKLQWLGLSSAAQSLSDIQEEITLLKEKLPDYSTFSDHLQNGYDYNDDGTKEELDSYADFDNYLAEGSNSISFTTSEADSFIEKIRQSFTDDDSSGSSFDEFKNFVVNESESFESLKTGFGTSSEITSDTETSSGQAVSGVRFHETSGVTRNGVSVPAGTTEVYGKEVHFSQAEPAQEETGSISFNSISASNTTPDTYDTVTISCNIDNTYPSSKNVVATFLEDGNQLAAEEVSVPGNGSATVSFSITKTGTASHDYAIKTTSTITVSWTSPGVTG